MNLTFDIDRVVAVERHLGFKLSDIVKEAESETGLALGTLRALLAAGSVPTFLARLGIIAPPDFERANLMIEKHGLAACASAVGKALGAFLVRINRETT